MEDTLGKTLNEKAVQHNSFIVEYCRTSVAVLAGVTAGILGLTGLVGFGLYLVFSLLLSMMLIVKAGAEWNRYFTSRRVLVFDGMLNVLQQYAFQQPVWRGKPGEE